MTITQFVEKAIEGGWFPKGNNPIIDTASLKRQVTMERSVFYEKYILDPKAWQAVGLVSGWDERIPHGYSEFTGSSYSKNGKGKYEIVRNMKESTYYMHQMIDSLAEGNSIEDFIKTL